MRRWRLNLRHRGSRSVSLTLGCGSGRGSSRRLRLRHLGVFLLLGKNLTTARVDDVEECFLQRTSRARHTHETPGALSPHTARQQGRALVRTVPSNGSANNKHVQHTHTHTTAERKNGGNTKGTLQHSTTLRSRTGSPALALEPAVALAAFRYIFYVFFLCLRLDERRDRHDTPHDNRAPWISSSGKGARTVSDNSRNGTDTNTLVAHWRRGVFVMKHRSPVVDACFSSSETESTLREAPSCLLVEHTAPAEVQRSSGVGWRSESLGA